MKPNQAVVLPSLPSLPSLPKSHTHRKANLGAMRAFHVKLGNAFFGWTRGTVGPCHRPGASVESIALAPRRNTRKNANITHRLACRIAAHKCGLPVWIDPKRARGGMENQPNTAGIAKVVTTHTHARPRVRPLVEHSLLENRLHSRARALGVAVIKLTKTVNGTGTTRSQTRPPLSTVLSPLYDLHTRAPWVTTAIYQSLVKNLG